MKDVRAFSMIELVFVVAILGILSALFFKTSFTNPCFYRLGGVLSAFQDEITKNFTLSYIAGRDTGSISYSEILHNAMDSQHFISTPTCSIHLSYPYLNLRDGDLSTTFAFSSASLRYNPKLSCPFSDLLCKKIHHRLSLK